ncbi:unnamed protein product, partial [Brassica rapa]
MARLQGASKPPASVRTLKKSSSLAGALCAAAAITTEVVEMADSPVKGSPAEANLSGSDCVIFGMEAVLVDENVH